MPHAATYAFAYHQMLVVIAGSVCLFGTWVGMRHFARARATEGTTRIGWLFMASVGTGAALWASTFISILALDPSLNTGFEPVATGAVLVIAIVACLIGFEIGSRHFTLAPEAGGLVMGVGILAMHFIALQRLAHRRHVEWNVYGVVVTFAARPGLQRARGQPRQPAGDALVPPWRRDRAGLHDLRHALRADGLDLGDLRRRRSCCRPI